MKNAIRYYYQIEVNHLEYKDKRYYFDNYVLVEVEKELDFVLYQFLWEHQYPIYPIIYNIRKEAITLMEGKKYLLLLVLENGKVNYETILSFQIPMQQEAILPWHELWMNKVDFYENHIRTISSNKIKESFFYYVGMTENAISFYQMIKKQAPLFLSHNRMTDDFDYWNPLNISIDYKVRDIAEYTKKLFFEEQLKIEELFSWFQKFQFQEEDYLLFYARMLYPSYYYDAYDEIVKGKKEDYLEKYLSKIEDYETFLRHLYYSFSQFLFMPKIDWLVEIKKCP